MKSGQIHKLAAEIISQRCSLKKGRNGQYIWPINEEFLGWMGLNIVVRKPANLVTINPVLGIRSSEVQATIAFIEGDTPHKYEPPTFSQNIGYFMPLLTYKVYECRPCENEIRAIIENIIENIEEYIIPFWQSHWSLDCLNEILLKKGGVWEDVTERLLTIAYLQGKDEADLSSLYQERLEQVENSNVCRERVRFFFEKLLKVLHQEETSK